MRARLLGCGVLAAFFAALIAAPLAAPAQPAASPRPLPRATATAEDTAEIIAPLHQIGRVRARSPYCAALARAGAGIDGALAYEYGLPIVQRDLHAFKLGTELDKAASLKRTERDLEALWNLSTVGRADIVALRSVAAGEADPARRKEMTGLADALDGARGRQQMLARGLARSVGFLAEQQVHTEVNKRSDDLTESALDSRDGGRRNVVAIEPPDPVTYTTEQADAIKNFERTQEIFGSYAIEKAIHDDLKIAADHGTAAMQLGGCSS